MVRSRHLKVDNLKTKKIRLTNRSIQNYLYHAYNIPSKLIIQDVYQNISKLELIKSSKLGITKDLTKEKNVKNVSKKANRGVIEYNQYRIRVKGANWVIGLENIKNKYEQPYYIYKEKA